MEGTLVTIPDEVKAALGDHLNEVAQQGNPQQKNEAQELLKRVPA